MARRLMVFSAHPDDESTSFGGILALSAAMDVETIVITSTDGALGDSIEGYKPGNVQHYPEQVIFTRRQEIFRACEILGVEKQEFLGFGDSGMPGWEYLHHARTFSCQPHDVVVGTIREVLVNYQPDIVLSHDPFAQYQHIDHILTGRYVAAAIKSLSQKFSPKLYGKFHGRAYWHNICHILAQAGIKRENPYAYTADCIPHNIEEVDVTSVITQKYHALHAHKSQLQSSSLAKLNLALFTQAVGIEHYYQIQESSF